MKRKIISILLTLVMVVTMIPQLGVMAFADTGDDVETPPFTIEGVDGNYKVTEGAPLSLDETKPHYVIHLTEDAVSSGSWTISDSTNKCTLFWAGDKVASGWTFGSMAATTNPASERKNDEGAAFAALPSSPPPTFFQNGGIFNQQKAAAMSNTAYYYTVEADYGESSGGSTVTIPDGAVFTDVTCDVEGKVTIKNTGETVDKGGDTAPLYLITVPEDASAVYIKFPIEKVFYDSSVYGYGYTGKEFDDQDFTYSYQTFGGEVDEESEDYVIMSMNVDDFLKKDNKQGGPEAPAEDGYVPVCAFTFDKACAHKNVEKVAGVEAKCLEPGSIEYWHCEDCGKYFKNQGLTEEFDPKDAVIDALGHNFGSNGKCTRCGLSGAVDEIPEGLKLEMKLGENGRWVEAEDTGWLYNQAKQIGTSAAHGFHGLNFVFEHDEATADKADPSYSNKLKCYVRVTGAKSAAIAYGGSYNTSSKIFTPGTTRDYKWLQTADGYYYNNNAVYGGFNPVTSYTKQQNSIALGTVTMADGTWYNFCVRYVVNGTKGKTANYSYDADSPYDMTTYMINQNLWKADDLYLHYEQNGAGFFVGNKSRSGVGGNRPWINFYDETGTQINNPIIDITAKTDIEGVDMEAAGVTGTMGANEDDSIFDVRRFGDLFFDINGKAYEDSDPDNELENAYILGRMILYPTPDVITSIENKADFVSSEIERTDDYSPEFIEKWNSTVVPYNNDFRDFADKWQGQTGYAYNKNILRNGDTEQIEDLKTVNNIVKDYANIDYGLTDDEEGEHEWELTNASGATDAHGYSIKAASLLVPGANYMLKELELARVEPNRYNVERGKKQIAELADDDSMKEDAKKEAEEVAEAANTELDNYDINTADLRDIKSTIANAKADIQTIKAEDAKEQAEEAKAAQEKAEQEAAQEKADKEAAQQAKEEAEAKQKEAEEAAKAAEEAKKEAAKAADEALKAAVDKAVSDTMAESAKALEAAKAEAEAEKAAKEKADKESAQEKAAKEAAQQESAAAKAETEKAKAAKEKAEKEAAEARRSGVNTLKKPVLKRVKAAKRKIAVKWKKVKGASGYEVLIANNKRFTKNSKVIVVRKGSKIKQVIKKLKKGKYFVKVRAFKKYKTNNLFSKYSNVKKVKVKK